MDIGPIEGDPRFLNMIRPQYPEIADALRYPQIEHRDQVRATLASLDREQLEDLFAVSVTYLLEILGMETQIGKMHIETRKYIEEKFKLTRQRGALMRHINDPKQAAKAEAFKLWKERRAGKHPRLRTNEQFAIECIRRWPVLTSASVICGWCTKWNKAAKAVKSQSAS